MAADALPGTDEVSDGACFAGELLKPPPPAWGLSLRSSQSQSPAPDVEKDTMITTISVTFGAERLP